MTFAIHSHLAVVGELLCADPLPPGARVLLALLHPGGAVVVERGPGHDDVDVVGRTVVCAENRLR